jgi:4-hydroxy-3-methylbut-2-enyl diphosphate reductase
MKSFNIPEIYKSSIISEIKTKRKIADSNKKNFTPTILNFGPVEFVIARHFGFCFGVENAIEIAYRTINENKDKRIFLLSEMIHNPGVNEDLRLHGVQFLMDTAGRRIYNWDDLNADDIVIIPAFGTTREIGEVLKEKGIDPYKYNTTCPFVEKVWNRANSLGENKYTVIIHGKHFHEETRATFSHSTANAPSLIIRDLKEAKALSDIITGKIPEDQFYDLFAGRFSAGFDVKKDLIRIGVVNQTTMLASETEQISLHLKQAMESKFGLEESGKHFADTRDTLCYATNNNQTATKELLKADADFAIVIGGYNSSNTSHLVEVLETKFETYFVSSAENIEKDFIKYYDLENGREVTRQNYLKEMPVKIVLTSGASCPDSVVDAVIFKLLSFFNITRDISSVINEALSGE